MERSHRPPPRGRPSRRSTLGRASSACAILVVVTMLGGCAHSGGLRCDAGASPMVAERLYFGTERPGGVVSDGDWQAFVDDTIATRFPAGFTTWDAAGGWRGADGRTLREASHVVEVMRPVDATGAEAAIVATIADYKARFDQEAVLRVRTPACVGP